MEQTISARSFRVHGFEVPANTLDPGLHVVSTPIGHLGDITLRALSTLAAASVVLAEDTRVTCKLLSHYAIDTPLCAYHEHNAERMRPQILHRLASGEAVALVSDAGTPLVSDPGSRLVEEVVATGGLVVANPGASAVLAAFVTAALPSPRFFFEGFLPAKVAARRQRIAELAAVPGTLVFYESPRRVRDLLIDLAAVLGPRQAAMARELTKLHETVLRDTLPNLAVRVEDGGEVRGEVVVLVAPADGDTPHLDDGAIDARIVAALETLSVKDAAAVVSAETGQPRRKIYARAVALAASTP